MTTPDDKTERMRIYDRYLAHFKTNPSFDDDLEFFMRERSSARAEGFAHGRTERDRVLTQYLEQREQIEDLELKFREFCDSEDEKLKELQSQHSRLVAAARELADETVLNLGECESEQYARTWKAYTKVRECLSAASPAPTESEDKT